MSRKRMLYVLVLLIVFGVIPVFLTSCISYLDSVGAKHGGGLTGGFWIIGTMVVVLVLILVGAGIIAAVPIATAIGLEERAGEKAKREAEEARKAREETELAAGEKAKREAEEWKQEREKLREELKRAL